ncbi:MAG TPA: hypothetical protein EYG03_01690 [Planctomycetes bacterium]|nr:hypothetical protein [Planctomycetota bacterium]
MFTRIAAVLTFLALSTQFHSASAQLDLRWKFRAQETIKYNVQQKMQTKMKIGDTDVNQTMDQTMNMSWHVQSSSANGDTVMNQVVDRIFMKLQGGPAGVVEFDTGVNTKSESPIVNSMGEMFRQIVNQKFQVTMKPTGEITDVQVPAQLLDALRRSAAGNAGALDETTLQQMMKQSAVMLPPQAVAPRMTWSSRQSVQLGFGTMTIKSEMTFVEVDAAGNAIIQVVPEISVVPRPDAPIRMTLTSSSGHGEVVFNIDQGRVAKSQLDLDMAMTIESNGQTFDQTIKQVTTMTLDQ